MRLAWFLSLNGERGRLEAFAMAVDLGVRLAQARRLAFRADVESLGVDELDVGHAKEAEEQAHVGRVRVVRRAGINPAARGEDIGPLAGKEANRSLLGVAEGDAGARDVVEVRLERRR